VIGLGYNMGWKKFALTLLAGAFGADPVQFTKEHCERFGVDLWDFQVRFGAQCEDLVSRLELGALVEHCAVAKHFVDKYRRINAPVVDLWKFCDHLLEEMLLLDAGGTFGPQANFAIARHAIRKPAGMVLHYPGLRRAQDGGYVYVGGPVGKTPRFLYGGKLVENLVQSFCRDIILEQAVDIYACYGYAPVTTSHDELVYILPEARAEKALHEEILPAMAVAPGWCRALPLKASGGVGMNYGEAGEDK
jgi:hypothetical protein